MSAATGPPADAYEILYREFDSPLMQTLRREAYGEDIGQHSWVGADEMRSDIARLRLTATSRLLDLGCGPCGPLTFLMAATGCSGIGLDFSRPALTVGGTRARALGVEHRLTAREADLNQALPLEDGSCDAAISLDVVLHLHDRDAFFREVARVLAPGGRFLLTDAGVITGVVTSEAIRRRSAHGVSQFVPSGWNEARLAEAGFRVIETQDRIAGLLRNAGGRLAALQRHRSELEALLGVTQVERQQEYLEIALAMAREGAMSRVMVLAEAHAPAAR